jgi:hypothetical protein
MPIPQAMLFSCINKKKRVIVRLNNSSTVGDMIKRYVKEVFGLTDNEIINIKYDYNKGRWFCHTQIMSITGTFEHVEISTV